MKILGKNVFIRTLTCYYTGKVERITKNSIELSTAAWIADTGRFHNALLTGVLNEVEPYPGNVLVQRNNSSDITEWKHELPRNQK